MLLNVAKFATLVGETDVGWFGVLHECLQIVAFFVLPLVGALSNVARVVGALSIL